MSINCTGTLCEQTGLVLLFLSLESSVLSAVLGGKECPLHTSIVYTMHHVSTHYFLNVVL